MAAPAIDFGLLSDPERQDEAVMPAGIDLIRGIAKTAPLSEYRSAEMFPGDDLDNSELKARVYSQLQTVYHPTSTCRMGWDERAVVDPKLRAYGLDGLWVADASVMPAVPAGHPNALVAMIARRAAGWIEGA